MWDFILFIRDSITDISVILDSYYFDIAGISVSILDIFIGLICMGFILSIFWKGARY